MTPTVSYRTSFGKAFHRIILVAYVFFVLYEDNIIVRPEGSASDKSFKAFGGKFKYLTSINLIVLQLGYFALAAINDLAGTNEKAPNKMSILQRVRDFLFTTIIFPIAIYVCSIFWGLYYFDRKLIFPVSFEEWYPSWANHMEHSVPAGAVLLESLLFYHKFPRSTLIKNLPVLLSLIGYFAWVLYLKFEKNVFVYPFFSEFSDPALVGFLACIGLPAFLWLYLGYAIHNIVWGKESSQKKKEKGNNKNTKQQNDKKGGNKKQNTGSKKGKENKQQQASKNQKNSDLENAKRKQKIIEEPQTNKKQKNSNLKKSTMNNNNNNQNFNKNITKNLTKSNQEGKNAKASKKVR